MNKKEDNLKEKFKQALISTAKVISDDYKLEIKNTDKNFSSKNINFFEIDNLSNKSDFIKLRAETDAAALKKKFSDNKIYKKNLPTNISSRLLYNVAEKIRYEVLGGKMLKGIKKNLDENYYQKINLKRKDQLKSKEDVPVSEAFELYMLKKFHQIKLNSLTTKMLDFWKKDFDESVNKHVDFLNKNLENQDIYSSKFFEILQSMNIFDTGENEDSNDEKNQKDNQNNDSDDASESENLEEKKNEEETQVGLDAEYNIDEYKMDEQLVDTDSAKESSENVIQKKNIHKIDQDYKIFTRQFDEVAKAEILESKEEIRKLR